jgi:triosephosphate isomerase
MKKSNMLVVGNWKMNGSLSGNAELLHGLKSAGPVPCEAAVCAPNVYISQCQQMLHGTAFLLGAQDCSAHDAGAYTGEVGAAMLHEVGCSYVIVGHSERRAHHLESDALVAQKARQVIKNGMTPIVCVGETLAEREAGQTEQVVKRQLSAVIHELKHCISQVVVAYEPVWAIGTGKTASPEQAQAVHAVLRAQLHAASERSAEIKILYGGSVKPDNAKTLFAQADIDGGLIGGAALKAADFLAICEAAA